MVKQLHAPWAVVTEPRCAINEEFVFECESPHVHAVAESILHFHTGLLQRARVNCQESAWWYNRRQLSPIVSRVRYRSALSWASLHKPWSSSSAWNWSSMSSNSGRSRRGIDFPTVYRMTASALGPGLARGSGRGRRESLLELLIPRGSGSRDHNRLW